MKVCSVCTTEKPLDAFNRDKRRGHASRCKACNVIAVAAWREKNRSAHNASERKRYAASPLKWAQHIQRKYGVTAEAYQGVMVTQNGCCAICKASAADLGETLAVDHCHVSGAVRGLLCAKCNRMLGCANDRPDVLRGGAEYLINAEAARVFIEAVMECRP